MIRLVILLLCLSAAAALAQQTVIPILVNVSAVGIPGALLLEDNTSILLLEDNSSSLCLEGGC